MGEPFLFEDAKVALLPPKMRESTFPRAKLCQFAHEVDEPWLPPGSWDACTDARTIPDGTPVVLGLDGSFSQDCTALVAVSLEDTPHIDVVALWKPPATNPEYRLPVADVEQAIRDACRKYQVWEGCADPFRWTRSLRSKRRGCRSSSFRSPRSG